MFGPPEIQKRQPVFFNCRSVIRKTKRTVENRLFTSNGVVKSSSMREVTVLNQRCVTDLLALDKSRNSRVSVFIFVVLHLSYNGTRSPEK